jgi:hypothetical protein
MATHAAEGADPESRAAASLREQIDASVSEEPFRPWCVHRLHEELVDPTSTEDREMGLMRMQLAADQLAAAGRVKREEVNAFTIGVHCQDTLYWSPRAGVERLEEFGPDYQSPTLLRRLGAHFQCHGL